MKNIFSQLVVFCVLSTLWFIALFSSDWTEDGLEVEIHLNLLHLSTDMADFTTYHTIVLLLNNFAEGIQQEEEEMQLEGVRQMISEVSSYSWRADSLQIFITALQLLVPKLIAQLRQGLSAHLGFLQSNSNRIKVINENSLSKTLHSHNPSGYHCKRYIG